MNGPSDCTSCGTCCFSNLETYVAVTGDDHARLADAADSLVVFHGTRAFMKMADGHCAALRCDAGAARFTCGVYETRPTACRDLARGSPACAGEIATKGERPLVHLRRARA